MDYQIQTPVVLFIFKRPETTRAVFEVIRQAKPSRLYIIADGARHQVEKEKCEAARQIVDSIDWDCAVYREYSDVNLGLKKRLQTGLDWIFTRETEAIILEDDCLPDLSFFRFCQELLDYYRHHDQVMHISGDCFVDTANIGSSYYFSQFSHVWGWATWRRAWQRYDGSLASWRDPETRHIFLSQLQTASEKRFWTDTLDQVAMGVINTWDYQWTFSCIANRAVAINPSVNLVKNVGFGSDATNFSQEDNSFVDLNANALSFPLVHPKQVTVTQEFDRITANLFFSRPSLMERMASRVKGYWKRLIYENGG